MLCLLWCYHSPATEKKFNLVELFLQSREWSKNVWSWATNDTAHAQKSYLTVARLIFAEWRYAVISKNILKNIRLKISQESFSSRYVSWTLLPSSLVTSFTRQNIAQNSTRSRKEDSRRKTYKIVGVIMRLLLKMFCYVSKPKYSSKHTRSSGGLEGLGWWQWWLLNPWQNWKNIVLFLEVEFFFLLSIFKLKFDAKYKSIPSSFGGFTNTFYVWRSLRHIVRYYMDCMP